MTDKEIMDKVLSAMQYGQGWGGMSSISQFRNANAGLRELKKLNLPKGEGADVQSGLRSMKGQAVASGVMAGMSGLAQIGTGALDLSMIQDTSQQQHQINDIANIGTTDYGSFDQLAEGYSQLSNQPDLSLDNIERGTSEKVKGVLGTTMAGATAGMTIGGPWGALAGGIIGLGGGIGGVIAGNKNAEYEQDRLRLAAARATDNARRNLAAAHDQIQEQSFRRGLVNLSSTGGPLTRRQASIAGFIQGKRRSSSEKTSPACITRIHKEGGTMIKIRRK